MAERGEIKIVEREKEKEELCDGKKEAGEEGHNCEKAEGSRERELTKWNGGGKCASLCSTKTAGGNGGLLGDGGILIA